MLWVHKTWLARDDVLGTSCAHPRLLLLWATRLEKRVWKLPQNPQEQIFSPRVDWKETPSPVCNSAKVSLYWCRGNNSDPSGEAQI